LLILFQPYSECSARHIDLDYGHDIVVALDCERFGARLPHDQPAHAVELYTVKAAYWSRLRGFVTRSFNRLHKFPFWPPGKHLYCACQVYIKQPAKASAIGPKSVAMIN
jgi:hypothetical protein